MYPIGSLGSECTGGRRHPATVPEYIISFFTAYHLLVVYNDDAVDAHDAEFTQLPTMWFHTPQEFQIGEGVARLTVLDLKLQYLNG